MAERLDSSNPAVPTAVMQMLTCFWKPHVIAAAVKLGIPDLLAGETRSSEQLAAAGKINRASLYRLLRAMCAMGLCVEISRDMFELTAAGEALRSGTSESLHCAALFFGTQVIERWNRLADSVRTGQTAYAITHGAQPFDAFARDSQTAKIFHQAMLEITRIHAAGIAGAYEFSRLGDLVDVGGGYGEMLCTILRKNPAMRGVIFDLPHAQAGAVSNIEQAGLSDRCRFESGSFLETVPGGAGGYMLKSVIHDWEDNFAAQILTNCRKAMKPGARLLLIEQIVPQRIEAIAQHEMIVMPDLTMMLGPGGRERSQTEFNALLKAADLKADKIIPTPTPFSIIDAAAV